MAGTHLRDCFVVRLRRTPRNDSSYVTYFVLPVVKAANFQKSQTVQEKSFERASKAIMIPLF